METETNIEEPTTIIAPVDKPDLLSVQNDSENDSTATPSILSSTKKVVNAIRKLTSFFNPTANQIINEATSDSDSNQLVDDIDHNISAEGSDEGMVIIIMIIIMKMKLMNI